MLLVDHRQAEPRERHVLLKDGVGTDQDRQRAGFEIAQYLGARLALHLAGEQLRPRRA